MRFTTAPRYQTLTALWATDNYATSDTAPYAVANLRALDYKLEPGEVLREELVFQGFINAVNLSMRNPFRDGARGRLLDRATALYHLNWYLRYGQCCETAVFDARPDLARQFGELFAELVPADAFFYEVTDPKLPTASYTDQTALTWLGAETVGVLFFLGYD
ncbi:hypothetical protein [Hymenobacter psoromatis]|uniref:hypothetical protein n=1 Tax=Hymenobacter psoromatis TaxID=1484116 RepID=UPI001CBC02B1|nr:hypothetical protein [Hymenobacter psoromatis]